MVKVDNSPRKRIFTTVDIKLPTNIRVKSLVDSVIKKIEEIEVNANIETRNYDILKEFEEDAKFDDIREKISVFKYKVLIENSIDNLIAKKIFIKDLKSLKKDIFLLLTSDIETIRFYIQNLKNKNSNLLNKQHTNFKKYQDEFENLYSTHLSGNSSLKRNFFKLFSDVNACPYCNRNFVNPIYKKEKLGDDNKNQSPDIEHFFPKSKYPFLSLSISNLLPSCAFCNKIKSDHDTFENCKSPYEIDDNDLIFKFEPLDNQKRLIKVYSKLDNSKILNLDGLYPEVHSDYVNDIFLDINKHPIENRKYLKKFFSLPMDTQDKLYKKKFCNYYKDEDFNKQPLSKMTKDLFFHIKENEVK